MTRPSVRASAFIFAAAALLAAGCGRSLPNPPDFELDDGGLPRAGRGGNRPDGGVGGKGGTSGSSGTNGGSGTTGTGGISKPPPPPPPAGRDGGPPQGCSNGIIEFTEQCEGDPGLSCASVGLGGGGWVRCNPRSCQFDTGECMEPSCTTIRPVAVPPACQVLMCSCGPDLFSTCDGDCLNMLECAVNKCAGADRDCWRGCLNPSSPGYMPAVGLLSCANGNPLCFPNRQQRCGDGRIDAFEECDPGITGKELCSAITGADDGVAVCDPSTCRWDLSNCSFKEAFCGNSVAEQMESCDGRDLRGESCGSLGFGDGQLSCTGICTFNTSGCKRCGDGRLSPGEACDGNRFGGRSCLSLGYPGGELSCTSDCSLDTDRCARCGDGIITSGENCDGNNLNDANCDTLGFGSGTLRCSPSSCHYDTSGCTTMQLCGDGVAQADEQCDGMDFTQQSCESLGFSGGALSCNQTTCRFDTSSCNVGPNVQCTNSCIDETCSGILDQCDRTPGCQDLRSCLDGCRETPNTSCVLACVTSVDSVIVATVATDCVSDCAEACR